MSVITGITTAVRIAKRIDRRLRYLDPTNKFIQKYVPPGHRRRAFQIKRIADTFIVGGVIYEEIGNYVRGLQKKSQFTSRKFRQTRNYMEQPSSGRFQQTNYTARKRCPPRRR